jgi:flagellar hook protein FlgE
MMSQAFYTGISGIKNNAVGIDVLSNNLANINTVGFRGYTTEFSSLFEDAMASSKGLVNSIGTGVQVQTSSMVRDQGSLALSDRSTDMAILGDGWFGVQGENDPMYTRDGAFTFDSLDDLVTADGLHVLGTMGGNIDANDVLINKLDEVKLGDVTKQEKLRFPKSLTYPPEPTANAKFLANVGTGSAGFEVITVGASVIDPQNNRNHLRLEFTKDAVQNPPGSQWSVTATTQTLDGETIYDTQTGSVTFDAAGALTSSTLTTIDNNGAPVSIDLGSGYDGIVSIDIPVVSGSSVADGTIGGDLMGYSINKNAEVIATFTNGMQSSVGKVAIYHFSNEQGLDRISGTRFQESPNSGAARFFVDENGENINGTDVANFELESSNVQIAAGLTELIILQRSYDANSKSITTADQMIQKALQMDG